MHPPLRRRSHGPDHPHRPETLEKARIAYETSHRPVGEIAAMLGMSDTSFYRRVRIWGWLRRRRRRVRTNRPNGAGRGPVAVFSREADPALWHGERWAVDANVSETVRAFVEDSCANREAEVRRRIRAGERQTETIKHLARAWIGLQEVRRLDEASARRASAGPRDASG